MTLILPADLWPLDVPKHCVSGTQRVGTSFKSSPLKMVSVHNNYIALVYGYKFTISTYFYYYYLLYLNPPGAKISSVTYSPNGCHLATGLSNGEVQVFETSSSSPVFYLMRHKVRAL